MNGIAESEPRVGLGDLAQLRKLEARKPARRRAPRARVVFEPKPGELRGSFSVRLPLPPSANRYWRVAGAGVILTEEARSYKSAAAWQLAQAKIDPAPAGALVSVAVTVYRARKSGDLDNRFKVLFDAIEGVAYGNDSQIVRIVADRADDASDPRVELVLSWEMPGAPPLPRPEPIDTRAVVREALAEWETLTNPEGRENAA